MLEGESYITIQGKRNVFSLWIYFPNDAVVTEDLQSITEPLVTEQKIQTISK